MSECARAIKKHLADLEAGAIPHLDKPTALHHGMLTQAVSDIEYWQSMAQRAFVGGWAKACQDKNRAEIPVREVQERYQEWMQDVMENFS